eukprot:scaffold120132_cov48-Phaeocystis_antarctica.AAC.2
MTIAVKEPDGCHGVRTKLAGRGSNVEAGHAPKSTYELIKVDKLSPSASPEHFVPRAVARSWAMSEDLLEAVRGLRVADPGLGFKPLLAKLREQQPDLGAATKEVREALKTLKEIDAREAKLTALKAETGAREAKATALEAESEAIDEALEALTEKIEALQAEKKALTALKERDATREAKLTAEIEAVSEALKAVKERSTAREQATKEVREALKALKAETEA